MWFYGTYTGWFRSPCTRGWNWEVIQTHLCTHMF
jgi:hypothetical protein